MPKYFCEYCGIYLTHSSPGGRKQHSYGRKHINNKIEYYSQFLYEFQQNVLNSSLRAGMMPPGPGMPPSMGMPPRMMGPPPMMRPPMQMMGGVGVGMNINPAIGHQNLILQNIPQGINSINSLNTINPMQAVGPSQNIIQNQ